MKDPRTLLGDRERTEGEPPGDRAHASGFGGGGREDNDSRAIMRINICYEIAVATLTSLGTAGNAGQ